MDDKKMTTEDKEKQPLQSPTSQISPEAIEHTELIESGQGVYEFQQDLLTTALIGTARRSMPELPRAFANIEGLADGEDAAKSLLLASVVTDRYIKATTTAVEDFGSSLASISYADSVASHDVPVPAGAAREYLANLLKLGNHIKSIYVKLEFFYVRREFFQAMARAQRVCPPEFLPDWLVLAEQEQLIDLLGQGLGQRGKWLVRLHPSWRKTFGRFADVPAEEWMELFQTANKSERIYALRCLRLEDATKAEARDLLFATWKEDIATVRADLLSALHVNLSAADEAWLETLRQTERSNNIQAQAADLLAYLPSSKYVAECIACAERHLVVEAGTPTIILPKTQELADFPQGTLELLPNSSPTATHVSMLTSRIEGKKAKALARLLTCIPPMHWQEMLPFAQWLAESNLSISDQRLLRLSWTVACWRFADVKSSYELLQQALDLYLAPDTKDKKKSADKKAIELDFYWSLEVLLSQLSPVQADKLISKMLLEKPIFVDEDFILLFLQLHPAQYQESIFEHSEDFHKAFVNAFKTTLEYWNNPKSKMSSHSHVAVNMLNRFGPCLPVSCHAHIAHLADLSQSDIVKKAYLDMLKEIERRKTAIACLQG